MYDDYHSKGGGTLRLVLQLWLFKRCRLFETGIVITTRRLFGLDICDTVCVVVRCLGGLVLRCLFGIDICNDVGIDLLLLAIFGLLLF